MPRSSIVQKFEGWGYGFTEQNIVASRHLLSNALEEDATGMVWGIAAPARAEIHDVLRLGQRI